jgi:periplasmic divalent cation tolerance protein
MEILLFYVPCGSKDDAENLVTKLLDMGMIACGNVIASDSLFVWDGNINKENEWVGILKTLPSMEQIVDKQIEMLHAYQTSAIIRWSARCNAAYFDWLTNMITFKP